MRMFIRLLAVAVFAGMVLAYRPLQHAHGNAAHAAGQLLANPAAIAIACLVLALLLAATTRRKQGGSRQQNSQSGRQPTYR
jgi:hypothetical protein